MAVRQWRLVWIHYTTDLGTSVYLSQRLRVDAPLAPVYYQAVLFGLGLPRYHRKPKFSPRSLEVCRDFGTGNPVRDTIYSPWNRPQGLLMTHIAQTSRLPNVATISFRGESRDLPTQF